MQQKNSTALIPFYTRINQWSIDDLLIINNQWSPTPAKHLALLSIFLRASPVSSFCSFSHSTIPNHAPFSSGSLQLGLLTDNVLVPEIHKTS